MRYVRFEGHDPTQRSGGISLIQGKKASQFTRAPARQGEGQWVLLPIHVKFMMTSCAK